MVAKNIVDDLVCNVESLHGKNRVIKKKITLLCPGILGMAQDDLNKVAIKIDRDNNVFFDTSRCSKCYLCVLKSKEIILNSQNLPCLKNDLEKKNSLINLNDQLHFESCLSSYTEQSGISKWIYLLFKIFGFNGTYVECAIGDEYLDKKIMAELGFSTKKLSYNKSKIPDLESKEQNFIFVFENKKANTQSDDWINTALKQIIIYAFSSFYLNTDEEIVFIFCYNGSINIEERIKNVLNCDSVLDKYFNLFYKKKNYSFSLLTTADFYELVKRSLIEQNHDKQWIIELINKKKIRLR